MLGCAVILEGGLAAERSSLLRLFPVWGGAWS
ncbi:hypothetical protein E2320_015879, partial [Naja naja]